MLYLLTEPFVLILIGVTALLLLELLLDLFIQLLLELVLMAEELVGFCKRLDHRCCGSLGGWSWLGSGLGLLDGRMRRVSQRLLRLP